MGVRKHDPALPRGQIRKEFGQEGVSIERMKKSI
jgi:hypothetical protein